MSDVGVVYVRFPNFAFLIWVSRVVRLLWLLVSVGHRDACLSLCGPQTVFMSVFVPGLVWVAVCVFVSMYLVPGLFPVSLSSFLSYFAPVCVLVSLSS